ncbi:HAMP domain-containing sensor histidine kinase [Thermodesulfomicrobium sp. WS]|uniref:sensor histidine kinase n=1 Tax=Thermodesulfomicrobium sp. WS TaxID=3004129 RepID=UPI00248FB162|nr:HAMP domain-containing sensor histidine kinase [Thermodesulfomicrobium sp. WS]
MRPRTHFLPAERMRPDLLLLWREILPRYRDLRLLYLLETPWAIVTHTRQILRASPSFLAFGAANAEDAIVGKRPGEFLACVHSAGPLGCGTTEACRQCGAAQALAQALHQGTPAHITTAFLRRAEGRIQAINAQVTVAPFHVGFTSFALFSLLPTNEATEHQVLERVFFHDLLNGMNALVGALTLLTEQHTGEMDEFLSMVLERAWSMVREIQAYKTLHAAERGTFSVALDPVDLAALCRQLVAIHRPHPLAKDKHLAIQAPAALPMVSDPQLITRIVENLLKNALEASSEGTTVTITVAPEGAFARIAVHNPGVIPAEVQARIFQRGHSTKGTGRGFGTYGIRLFVENYLAGSVHFTSTPTEGTTFTVRLPLRHPLAGPERLDTQG